MSPNDKYGEAMNSNTPPPATDDVDNLCSCTCVCLKMGYLPECCLCCDDLTDQPANKCDDCGECWCTNCSAAMSNCTWCGKPMDAPIPPGVQVAQPCKYSGKGCKKLDNAIDIAKHAKTCRYKTMKCPFILDCGFYSMYEMFKHISTTHGIRISHSKSINVIAIDNPVTLMMKRQSKTLTYRRLFVHENKYFMFIFNISPNTIKLEVLVKKLRKKGPFFDPFQSLANLKYHRTYVELKSRFSTELFTFLVKANEPQDREVNWKQRLTPETDRVDIYIALDAYCDSRMVSSGYHHNGMFGVNKSINAMVGFEYANDLYTN